MLLNKSLACYLIVAAHCYVDSHELVQLPSKLKLQDLCVRARVCVCVWVCVCVCVCCVCVCVCAPDQDMHAKSRADQRYSRVSPLKAYWVICGTHAFMIAAVLHCTQPFVTAERHHGIVMHTASQHVRLQRYTSTPVDGHTYPYMPKNTLLHSLGGICPWGRGLP